MLVSQFDKEVFEIVNLYQNFTNGVFWLCFNGTNLLLNHCEKLVRDEEEMESFPKANKLRSEIFDVAICYIA